MFTNTKAFSSFAVRELDDVREFYETTLGIPATEMMDGNILSLKLVGVDAMIYRKPDFEPATYTVLNFAVDDVEAAVDALAAEGVEFERYEGFGQDDKGIARGNGPDIAWFKDPAGNLLSVVQAQ
jgi:predicted enzyme related to lactoylglutathione lyase